MDQDYEASNQIESLIFYIEFDDTKNQLIAIQRSRAIPTKARILKRNQNTRSVAQPTQIRP